MAAMIRPSLILQMSIDERALSDEVIAEIKRSYSYVAPSMVSSHEAASGAPENTMRFAVKLHKPYWDKNDAAAQELWEGVMPKWLHNMFYKVSSTIVASNKVRADQGSESLDYAWLEVEFGIDALVALKTAADSSVPEEAVQAVEQVRDLMASGAFGDQAVACVRVPSRASYQAQLAQAVADASADGDAAADAEDVSADGAAAAQPALPPKIDVDCGVWGVEYADGTVREFDSVAASFLS